MSSHKVNTGFLELSVDSQLELDAVCDSFEKQWRQNNDIRIEDIQSELDPGWEKHCIAELILIEIELRGSGNEPFGIQEYYDRFPDFHSIIQTAFDRNASFEVNLDAKPDSNSNVQSLDQTRDDGVRDRETSPLPFALPEEIGEFEIKERLGSGAFGVVYEAFDNNRQQFVALKFPTGGQVGEAGIREDLIDEARAASRLHHPGIVEVLEFRQQDEFLFMVQELVSGSNLKEYSKNKLGQREVVKLVADIAEATGYAHRQGIYHRDLKPTNILIDSNGRPQVTDFGLAIHHSVQYSRRGERAGSPAYMSPELVRGESHLIDGRSDIWSVGIILYELLVGRRPFTEESTSALFDQIKLRETMPLRQLDANIPVDLERICLRCLAKKIGDRYLTANDLADELRQWLDAPDSSKAPKQSQIAPQGLRAFGADDADCFIQLLPGPRDRSELPLSLQFWKTRIESPAPEVTFATGLIYGPSGSGKSSFLRAGVLPRLSKEILPIYVEATSGDTEVRILKAVRRHFEDVPLNWSLPEVLAGLRERRWTKEYRKILLILDQFEQWLHSHDVSIDEQLIEALRQSDGKSLQTIIMVRDDFWLATSRFKDSLDTEFVDGHNAMLIDRFDKPHAQNVLTSFGQAFGRLPQSNSDFSDDQHEFLEGVVDDLAEEGHVISVRLSLFAEMFKNRDWSISELQKVGGIAGVGETFLEETFSRKTSLPKYRNYAKPIRAILEQLLPSASTTIKGQMRTEQALAEAAGFPINDPSFQEIIGVLVKELRLITPTEPDLAESTDDLSDQPTPGEKYFQLTHDYLVQPIRNWLNRKKKETWKGRAAIRLEELANQYKQTEEKRFLPVLPEYVSMRLGVPAREQSKAAKVVMKKATRRHALFLGAWGLVGLATAGTGLLVRRNIGQQTANGIVKRLVACEPFSFESVYNELLPYQKTATPMVAEYHDHADRKKRFNSLAASTRLLGEPEFIQKLVREIPLTNYQESILAAKAFRTKPDISIRSLKESFANSPSTAARNRYATLLLQLDETDELDEVLSFAVDPSNRTEWIHQFAKWPGDFVTFIAFLGNSKNAATVSGLLVAFSEINESDFDNEMLAQLKTHAHKIFVEHPEPSCHAAAEYFLRKTGAESSCAAAPKNANWQVIIPDHLTMVRIPAGTLYQGFGIPDSIERGNLPTKQEIAMDPFWVSDKEVSVGLFKQFLNDPDYGGDRPKTPPTLFDDDKLPATSVSLLDVAMFCDWLNEFSGRESGLFIKDDGFFKANHKIVCDFSKNGFRLPALEEIDYVARAGTKSMYSFGGLSQRSHLTKYVTCAGNSSTPNGTRAQRCGARIPNQFGVFDSLGNATERCLVNPDGKSKLLPPQEDIDLKKRWNILYGNHFSSSSNHFCGWLVSKSSVTSKGLADGFRIVCSDLFGTTDRQ